MRFQYPFLHSLLFLLIITCSPPSQAQTESSTLLGKLVDTQTKEPIPFANIAIKGKYRGTSSNILGEFILTIDSLPIDLVISHVSYERKEIFINNAAQELSIMLDAKESTLEEVVVSTGKSDPRAYRLIDKTIQRVKNNARKVHYGRAFYRQKSKNDATYSELYEIFLDRRFSAMGRRR